jgi:hypothetical protein
MIYITVSPTVCTNHITSHLTSLGRPSVGLLKEAGNPSATSATQLSRKDSQLNCTAHNHDIVLQPLSVGNCAIRIRYTNHMSYWQQRVALKCEALNTSS